MRSLATTDAVASSRVQLASAVVAVVAIVFVVRGVDAHFAFSPTVEVIWKQRVSTRLWQAGGAALAAVLVIQLVLRTTHGSTRARAASAVLLGAAVVGLLFAELSFREALRPYGLYHRHLAAFDAPRSLAMVARMDAGGGWKPVLPPASMQLWTSRAPVDGLCDGLRQPFRDWVDPGTYSESDHASLLGKICSFSGRRHGLYARLDVAATSDTFKQDDYVRISPDDLPLGVAPAVLMRIDGH